MVETRALRLGRVRGIEVRAAPSLLAVAALVTWSLWDRFDGRGDVSSPTAFAMAVAGAALFFGSIFAHEAAHALEAQARGVAVRSITLFLFGGVTETRLEARRPADEFALTAIGPFTSFVAAAALGLAGTGAAEAGWDEAAAVAGHVAWLNVALGVFNLLPGAPLDGGRILRAVVWRATGDRLRATRVSARAGQLLGGVLIALGLAQVFFVPGAFVGGLWQAFIGWFLSQAAAAELAYAEARRWLGDLAAGTLADLWVEPIPDELTLDQAVDGWFRRIDADAFPVTRDGRVVGALHTDDVVAVPPRRRVQLRVRDVMRPVEGLPAVDAAEPAAELWPTLAENGVAIVRDGGRVGVVTPERLGAVLRRRALLDRPHRRRPQGFGAWPSSRSTTP